NYSNCRDVPRRPRVAGSSPGGPFPAAMLVRASLLVPDDVGGRETAQPPCINRLCYESVRSWQVLVGFFLQPPCHAAGCGHKPRFVGEEERAVAVCSAF